MSHEFNAGRQRTWPIPESLSAAIESEELPADPDELIGWVTEGYYCNPDRAIVALADIMSVLPPISQNGEKLDAITESYANKISTKAESLVSREIPDKGNINLFHNVFDERNNFPRFPSAAGQTDAQPATSSIRDIVASVLAVGTVRPEILPHITGYFDWMKPSFFDDTLLSETDQAWLNENAQLIRDILYPSIDALVLGKVEDRYAKTCQEGLDKTVHGVLDYTSKTVYLPPGVEWDEDYLNRLRQSMHENSDGLKENAANRMARTYVRLAKRITQTGAVFEEPSRFSTVFQELNFVLDNNKADMFADYLKTDDVEVLMTAADRLSRQASVRNKIALMAGSRLRLYDGNDFEAIMAAAKEKEALRQLADPSNLYSQPISILDRSSEFKSETNQEQKERIASWNNPHTRASSQSQDEREAAKQPILQDPSRLAALLLTDYDPAGLFRYITNKVLTQDNAATQPETTPDSTDHQDSESEAILRALERVDEILQNKYGLENCRNIWKYFMINTAEAVISGPNRDYQAELGDALIRKFGAIEDTVDDYRALYRALLGAVDSAAAI
ncbi:hypothetical protein CSA80_01730 [Candidatus Saccharibacteria bacterium]|nr:MAG: hypothetical protein CSA80_01730 [Candidatus Saccharibacteria bacterium]